MPSNHPTGNPSTADTRDTLSGGAAPDLAMTELLAQVRPKLRYILARYRIPFEDAEDLIHDALLFFLRKRQEIHSPEAWLVGTLRKLCQVYWTRRRLHESREIGMDAWQLPELSAATDETGLELDLRLDVSRAIDSMPRRQRAFLLVWLHEAPPDEVLAERFGYRPSSLRQIVKRCRSVIHRRIDPLGRDPA